MKNIPYGVPYQGSKNKIAKDIVSRLPPATNFVDLFCGGCAITHAALMSGKYKNFYANDLDGMGLRLFLGAANGVYENEVRWISRDEFFKLNRTDPYVGLCWSFGNNPESYAYSREIEPWKRALHFARIFGDLSVFKAMGVATDGTRTDIVAHKDEYKAAYIKWYLAQMGEEMPLQEVMTRIKEQIKQTSDELRQYLRDALKESGLTQKDVERRLGNCMARHYFGYSQWEFPTAENYNKMREWMPLKPFAEVYGVQKLNYSLNSLQNTNSMQSLDNLQRLNRINTLMQFRDLINTVKPSYKDYTMVEIPDGDCLLYCDIPYRDTAGYATGDFDYEAFYDWALKQKNLVVVSEYWMPDTFREVYGRLHTCGFAAKKTSRVTEKLFVPAHQAEEYYRRLEEKNLFNYE